MTNPLTVEEMMVAYAQDAVDHAQSRFAITLDYSEKSVVQVEEMLAQLYEALPKGFWQRLFKRGASTADIAPLCGMFGGYIGEVIRRKWGGEWVLESLNSSEPLIALKVKGSLIFPPSKVYKRLIAGDEDNVWFYFEVISSQFKGEDRKTLDLSSLD
jgi:hypothetical protein